MLRKYSIILLAVFICFFTGCKGKKSLPESGINHSPFPAQSDNGQDFPSEWKSTDNKIYFIIDSGPAISKTYKLKVWSTNKNTFAKGRCFYSNGEDTSGNPCLILEAPAAKDIDISKSDSQSEEMKSLLEYMFPDGENCVIKYQDDYQAQDKKGAFVYRNSIFFDFYYTRTDNDFSNEKDEKPVEMASLTDMSFSLDGHYITDPYCTFGSIELKDDKLIYDIESESGVQNEPMEVTYTLIHTDGMSFIKMSRPFPKEFSAQYLNDGVDVSPDDKMLFLACKTGNSGTQALGITRSDTPAFMMIAPRWNEMSGRVYKNETSHLVEKNGTEYPVQNLCSMESDTPWVEGASGNGIGESFVIENTWETVYKTLLIMNGYISYEKPFLYKQNNRVKKIKVTGVKSGNSKILDVLDTPHPQTVDISFITEAEDIKVEIAEVYEGTKYDDTCLHFCVTYQDHVIPYETSIK